MAINNSSKENRRLAWDSRTCLFISYFEFEFRKCCTINIDVTLYDLRDLTNPLNERHNSTSHALGEKLDHIVLLSGMFISSGFRKFDEGSKFDYLEVLDLLGPVVIMWEYK